MAEEVIKRKTLLNLSLKSLKAELSILSRIIYKVKNQQRHAKAFQHI